MRVKTLNIKRLTNPPEPKDHQDDECGLCGRPMAVTASTWWVECVGGGITAVHRDDRHEINHARNDYMGCFPIGPTCARKVPAGFRFQES